jgi:hypothetical protein
MGRAIRQMRISLQTKGASRVANPVAAKNFDAAKGILAATERIIQDRFPYLYEAVLSLPENQILSHEDYKDEDYTESIRLMMGIRQELQPFLHEIKEEISRIQKLL